MDPPTNLRFKVSHLEINVWLLSIIDLLFDNICRPFVKIDLESMFQNLLYDNIYRLQFTSTNSWNKHYNDV
jgi:hypothetical protein